MQLGRVVAGLIALIFAGVQASFADEDAAALRNQFQKLNVSLKQASLAEGITQTACFVISGIDRGQVRNEAFEYIDGFTTGLSALRDGHEWLELLPEHDPEVLTQLNRSDAQWRRFRPAVEQIIHGDFHTVVVRQLLTENGPARERSHDLADQMIREYAPGLSSAQRVGLIETAAQRTRTQQALSQLCFFINDIGGHEIKRNLIATLDAVDLGFVQLSTGTGPVLEIPNTRVQRNLRTAALFWKKIRTEIDAIVVAGHVDPATIRKTLKFNKSVLKQLNQAVENYLPRAN